MEEGQERSFRPAAAFRMSFSIPSKDNGRLIGKGGETIKGLSAQFGVHIDIPKGQEPHTTVTVSGDNQKSLDGALEKISSLLGFKVGGSASAVQAAPTIDLNAANIRHALFFPDLSNASFDKFFTVLRSTKVSLDVAVYTLSDQRIAELILSLHKQGVKVRIISDNDTMGSQGSDVLSLARAGVPVRLDGLQGGSGGAPLRESVKGGASSLMHHKFAVLDGKVLATGSYNWTSTAASLNSENIMITNESFFVQAFASQFEQMWNRFAQFHV
jgi:hypothetical protein